MKKPAQPKVARAFESFPWFVRKRSLETFVGSAQLIAKLPGSGFSPFVALGLVALVVVARRWLFPFWLDDYPGVILGWALISLPLGIHPHWEQTGNG
jgi:hypothetical protein